MRHTTFRFTLDPTPEQVAQLARHAEASRFAYKVSAQVFEEAAVDLGRGLAAYAKANGGTLQEHRSGFPRPKRKGRSRDSFRIRNRISRSGRSHIRIGESQARTIVLPTIGAVRVHDDTRRLRRLLRPVEHCGPLKNSPALAPRARLLFATVARHGDRWMIGLNVEHPPSMQSAVTARLL
jgi:putative transposase